MEDNKKFIITCDSACDMTKEMAEILGVYVIPFEYNANINGKEEIFLDCMNEKDHKEFYDNMRHGTIYKTSQINVDRYMEFFLKLAHFNLPILHISLCNALSNTIENARFVSEELKKSDSKMDIKVVDGKIASLGLGLLVNKACALRKEGLDIDEVKAKIEECADNMGVYYTTNTLTYFARGGRLSKTASFIASALRINVILDCDKNGGLRTIAKCHGRNKAKQYIINKIKDSAKDPKSQVLYVCASDCKDEATLFASQIVKEVGFKYYVLTSMGPIIGAHAGPGLLSVFYETNNNIRN